MTAAFPLGLQKTDIRTYPSIGVHRSVTGDTLIDFGWSGPEGWEFAARVLLDAARRERLIEALTALRTAVES